MKKKSILTTALLVSVLSLSACNGASSVNDTVQSLTEDDLKAAEEAITDVVTTLEEEAPEAVEAVEEALPEAVEAVEAAAEEIESSMSSVPTSEIYDKISNSVELISPVEISGEFLENYYGIDLSLLGDYSCYMSEEATSAETIFILNTIDEQAATALKSIITTVKEDKATEMKDYLPEQYEIVEKSEVMTSGNYVWLVISEKSDEINEIIKDSIKGI